MKRFLSKWFKLPDIPNYLALLAALIVGALRVFAYPFGAIEGVILFLLALIAASILVDRKTENEFRQKVFTLAEGQRGVTGFLMNLGDLPPLEERLINVNEIWISGPTLAGFFLRYEKVIEEQMKKGVKVRCLIGPSQGELANYILSFLGSASLEPESSRYYYSVNLSMNILKAWRNSFDSLEVRVLPVMPSHNLLIVNPETPDGEAQVHLNVYNQDTDRNPVILVRALDSPENFTLFKNEFKELWEHSKDCGLPGAPGRDGSVRIRGDHDFEARRLPGQQG
jgi:hypothetical protein